MLAFCADGKKEIITASLDKTMALWRLEVRRSTAGQRSSVPAAVLVLDVLLPGGLCLLFRLPLCG